MALRVERPLGILRRAIVILNARPQRCQREGAHYTGENIATGTDSGRTAMSYWFHSSGHHRNMIAAHRSMGLGNVGDLWTEDFGTDDPQ